uniref:WD repeat domain 17 n=1 Tax=Cynoglossus semilaevis TaxID=244447 RepID=A0A3P8W9Z8_CYNSE
MHLTEAITHWFLQCDVCLQVRMAKVKQVGLLAAGCQPWNKDVCAASGDRFAYCATLAIYIYQLDQQYNEYKLRSIMSEHKKTITAISWCSNNPDLFASASADNLLIVWNVAEQRAVARLDNTKGVPTSVSWCWNSADGVAFVSQRGPLYIWVYGGSNPGLTVHKEAHSFLSDICLFRWHPSKKGKLVFGHTDGSLSIFQPGSRSQKHVLRPESLEGTDEEDPVSALEWDLLSTDYLLVSNLHNGIRLVDSEALTCITSFCFPSAAASVQCLAWVPSAPGMFITGDSQVGVLRVWNVSRSTPLDSFKLKKNGFHALHVINSPLAKKGETLHQRGRSSTPSQNRSFSLPPGHAVCCFMDGGVGLYDMGAKKWDFLRDLGHVETIFDCKFKPDDPNLLATASFDGTIKIWDTNTLTAVNTSPGNEGVVYSLSWAPGDLNCIAGATSRNGAFIWDVRKGKIITRFNEHGKNGIFCISWSHKDSKRIATCSGDGFCIIRTIDGKILHKYKHPAAVFGCDWSQNNKDMIATGCEDKNVRVYYLATSSDQPLKVFTGHLAKVFHVRWSPLREGILCSGSDDGTVRIWDYTQDACINVLSGHTAPVRGLMWNTEVPYLLISGSWDYTIRVWDTRDGTCLDTAYDHGADVYGLTCHQSRPFTMASCSRDSTVRLWSLTPVVSPLLLNILTGQPWEKIIGNTDTAMVPGSPPLLCGKVSRDIKQELDKLSADISSKRLRWFSECFSPPGGSSNLWDLVSVINGQDDSLLPCSYSKGVMHMKHLLKFKTWEKALAVAPGVSMKYWKKLMQRRADQLMAEDNDDAIPYCIATADVKKLVTFFSGRGQLLEALLIAQGACEGNIPVPPRLHLRTLTSDLLLFSLSSLLHRVCKELAEWYFQDGCSVLAACCHLAVDNIKMALCTLIRGNELELASCVGIVLGEAARQTTAYCLELLARKYMTTHTWELSANLLQMIPDNQVLLAKLCSLYPGSPAEINHLHERCGLPPSEECKALAEAAMSEGDLFSAVKFHLLSPEPENALQLGIDHIKEQLSGSDWTVDSVHHILDLMSYIRTDRLMMSKLTEARSELLILCGYTGALLAIRRQYSSIVPALYEYTSQLLKRKEVCVPLKIEQLSVELEAWRACTQSHSKPKLWATSYCVLTHLSNNKHVSCVFSTAVLVLRGADYVTGSNLPSHSDVQLSCFTGQRIQGPVFLLEDGKSAISLNDALMWAKVNPFSPLGTGLRINPF